MCRKVVRKTGRQRGRKTGGEEGREVEVRRKMLERQAVVGPAGVYLKENLVLNTIF